MFVWVGHCELLVRNLVKLASVASWCYCIKPLFLCIKTGIIFLIAFIAFHLGLGMFHQNAISPEGLKNTLYFSVYQNDKLLWLVHKPKLERIQDFLGDHRWTATSSEIAEHIMYMQKLSIWFLKYISILKIKWLNCWLLDKTKTKVVTRKISIQLEKEERTCVTLSLKYDKEEPLGEQHSTVIS